MPIGISCLGLYLAFHDFNLDEFNNNLRSLNYYLVGGACLLLILSVWLRAIRWELLFRSEGEISTFSLFKNQLIGYFGNNVLPLRFGEVIRAYLLGKEHNITSTYVFGTVINEKIIDMITLLLFFLLLFSIKSVQFSLYKYMVALLLAIIISISIVVLFIFFKDKILRENINNYLLRFETKPGITGLAAISGYRGGTNNMDLMQKRIDKDIEYIKTWSLLSDFKICIQTAFETLFLRGKGF